MELELQGKNLERETIEKQRAKEMEDFIHQLEKFVNNKNPLRNKIEERICVVKDRKDERLTLVNIENGEELDIFLAKSEQDIKRLNERYSTNHIYRISEEDFYQIDLGESLSLEDGKCNVYHEKIDIKNKDAFQKLEDLYFNLKEEEGQEFTVDKITKDKIFLEGKEGGYFSIYKKAYPNFKIGNTVKKEDGKYILES